MSIAVPFSVSLFGIHERVGEVEVDVVAMQAGRQAGRIGIPVQDVESRRLVAEQVVVDPVVPDQVVRPHPGEHPCQIVAVDHAAQPGGFLGGVHRLRRHQRAECALVGRCSYRAGKPRAPCS